MALSIPTKKTGDQLTADEFNQVVAEINRVVEEINDKQGKIRLVADENAYDAISPKDPETLYCW